jgi:hypothetical protein
MSGEESSNQLSFLIAACARAEETIAPFLEGDKLIPDIDLAGFKSQVKNVKTLIKRVKIDPTKGEQQDQLAILTLQIGLFQEQIELLEQFRDQSTEQPTLIVKRRQTLSSYQQGIADLAVTAEPTERRSSIDESNSEPSSVNEEDTTRPHSKTLTAADALSGKINLDFLKKPTRKLSDSQSSDDGGLDSESELSLDDEYNRSRSSSDSSQHSELGGINSDDEGSRSRASSNNSANEIDEQKDLQELFHEAFPQEEDRVALQDFLDSLQQWNHKKPEPTRTRQDFLGTHTPKKEQNSTRKNSDLTQAQTPANSSTTPLSPSIPPRRDTKTTVQLTETEQLLAACDEQIKKANQLIVYNQHHLPSLFEYHIKKNPWRTRIEAVNKVFEIKDNEVKREYYQSILLEVTSLIGQREHRYQTFKNAWQNESNPGKMAALRQEFTTYAIANTPALFGNKNPSFGQVEALYNEHTKALEDIIPTLKELTALNLVSLKYELTPIAKPIYELPLDHEQITSELVSLEEAKKVIEKNQLAALDILQQQLAQLEAKKKEPSSKEKESLKALNDNYKELKKKHEKVLSQLEKQIKKQAPFKESIVNKASSSIISPSTPRRVRIESSKPSTPLSSKINSAAVSDNSMDTGDSGSTPSRANRVKQLLSSIPKLPHRHRSESTKGKTEYVGELDTESSEANAHQIAKARDVLNEANNILDKTYDNLRQNWRETLTSEASLDEAIKLLEPRQNTQKSLSANHEYLVNELLNRDVTSSNYPIVLASTLSKLEDSEKEKAAISEIIDSISKKIEINTASHNTVLGFIDAARKTIDKCNDKIPLLHNQIKQKNTELKKLETTRNNNRKILFQIVGLPDTKTNDDNFPEEKILFIGPNKQLKEKEDQELFSKLDEIDNADARLIKDEYLRIKQQVVIKEEELETLQDNLVTQKQALKSNQEYLSSQQEDAADYVTAIEEFNVEKRIQQQQLDSIQEDIKVDTETKDKLVIMINTEKEIKQLKLTISSLQNRISTLPNKIKMLNEARSAILQTQQQALSNVEQCLQQLEPISLHASHETKKQIEILRKAATLLSEQHANLNETIELEAIQEQTDIKIKQHSDSNSPKTLLEQKEQLEHDLRKLNKAGSRIEHKQEKVGEKLDKHLPQTPKQDRRNPIAVTPLTSSQVRTEAITPSSIVATPPASSPWSRVAPLDRNPISRRLFSDDEEDNAEFEDATVDQRKLETLALDAFEDDDAEFEDAEAKNSLSDDDPTGDYTHVEWAEESEFYDETDESRSEEEFDTEFETTQTIQQPITSLPSSFSLDFASNLTAEETRQLPNSPATQAALEASFEEPVEHQLDESLTPEDKSFIEWAQQTTHIRRPTINIPPSTPTNTRNAKPLPKQLATTPIKEENSSSPSLLERMGKVAISPVKMVNKATRRVFNRKKEKTSPPSPVTATSMVENLQKTNTLVTSKGASAPSLANQDSNHPLSDKELLIKARGFLIEFNRNNYKFNFKFKIENPNINVHINQLIATFAKNSARHSHLLDDYNQATL